jgi:hypothetical protein
VAQLVQSSNLKLAAEETGRRGSVVKRRQNLKEFFNIDCAKRIL